MGQKIGAPDALRLLPQFMRRDKANAALAAAVSELIRDPGSRARQLRVWDQIDALPEAQLDELAWELGIDWYKSSMAAAAKRAAIKNARLIKAHRGTKYAVEELVSSYLGSGTVVEWFEIGGRPYTFYVCTEESVADASVYSEFLAAVNAGKNVRSRLLGVYAYITHTAAVQARHEGTAGAFVFVRAGTRPAVQNVGALAESAARSAPETLPAAFAYTRCGTRVCRA